MNAVVHKVRRIPALTRLAREEFEAIIRKRGWTPGETINDVALRTGLSPEQVRDAIFGAPADAWRRDLTQRLLGERNASS